jgi:hypothetical protein
MRAVAGPPDAGRPDQLQCPVDRGCERELPVQPYEVGEVVVPQSGPGHLGAGTAQRTDEAVELPIARAGVAGAEHESERPAQAARED